MITYLLILGVEIIIVNFSSSEEPSLWSKRFITLREIQPNSNFKGNDKRPELKIDADGFIEPSIIYQEADTEIVFLGGSTTACVSVPDSLRFPYLTGRLLEQETHLKINSYNGGRPGNDIIDSYVKLLNVVIQKQPDCVILMHNVNDVTNLLYTGSYWSGLNKFRLKKFSFDDIGYNNSIGTKNSLFPYTQISFQRLSNRLTHNSETIDEWGGILSKSIKIDSVQLYKDFESALQSFVHTCKAWNIPLILMTQQNRISNDNGTVVNDQVQLKDYLKKVPIRYFQAIYAKVNTIIRNVSKEHQLLLIDLDESIPKKEKYIFDLVHLSSEGSRLAAKVISDSLLKHISFVEQN